MLIVREKERRKAHRVSMRERHCKMKVVFPKDLLEVIKNLPIQGYLFSDWGSDALWFVNAGKPFVRPSCTGIVKTILFDSDYKTLELIDIKGFLGMCALPVKMCIERGYAL